MQIINVYGTGENAVKFVLEHRGIEVAAFIEGRKKSKRNFMSNAFREQVPIIDVKEADVYLKKHYTVIASSEPVYWEIKRELEKNYGLVEFEDFEYFETYGKKVAIIYGNCHTTEIKRALKSSKSFCKEYGFYPLKPIQEIKNFGNEHLENLGFQKCELFIHQCIRTNNFYGEKYASAEIIKKLKPNCKIIGVPNLYRLPRFLFPQVNYESDFIIWENYNFFPFRDKYIDENYKNLSINEIKELIMDDNLINASDIIAEKDKFFEKLVLREMEWDIKISDFLYSRLREEQLFYDPNHPTNIVIKYITDKVLEILKLKDKEISIEVIHRMDTYEIPVYNTVRKALGLNNTVVNIRKYNGLKINSLEMNLDEYIRQYILWNFGSKFL